MSEDRPTYPVNDPLAHGTPPPTPAEIAERLRRLADDMHAVGVDMEYFGGFGKAGARGVNMQDVSHIVRAWAHEIEGAQG